MRHCLLLMVLLFAARLPAAEPYALAEKRLVVPKDAAGVGVDEFVRREVQPSAQATAASVSWNDAGLRVVFDCADDKVIARPRDEDDVNVWRDDCVEVFIDVFLEREGRSR